MIMILNKFYLNIKFFYSKMNKPTPMVVFFTYQNCDHCKAFRGSDGKPNSLREWNSNYIRRLLVNKDPKILKKLKCSRIINIHDYTSGAKVENIGEFIIYSMIPSRLVVDGNLFNKLMADEVEIIGDSILRVAIKRNIAYNTIEIEVEIDGNGSDYRCPQIETLVWEFFFWNRVPLDYHKIRDYLLTGRTDNIDLMLSQEFKSSQYYNLIKKEASKIKENYYEYDKIVKEIFDYNWFLDNFFPTRIRELEIFYPTWMLILPSEWSNGFGGRNKVYGKIETVEITLQGDTYKSRRTINENFEDLITQYYSGRLFLTYKENLAQLDSKKSVKFSIGNTVEYPGR